MILGTVRASSLADALDCGLRWSAKYLDGKFMPSSGAAHLGTSVHKGAAVFDTSRLEGKQPHLDEAAEAFVQTLRNPEQDVLWDEDMQQREAEAIGLKLTTKYCIDLSPTRDYSAVELKFDSLEVSTEYGVICVSGTADRVRIATSGEGISDLKTGRTAVAADGRAVTKGHAAQLGLYHVLAEQQLGRPLSAAPEIIGMNTSSNLRIGVGEMQSAREAVIGTSSRPGVIEIMARRLKTGAWEPNPRSNTCHPKFCPIYPCPYVGKD